MTQPNPTRQGDRFRPVLMSTLVGLIMFSWLSHKFDSGIQVQPEKTPQTATVKWLNPFFHSLKQVSGGTSAGVR